MIKIDPEFSKYFIEIYVVANTSTYLYRQFRSKEIIRDLANRYPEKDLINYIKKIDSSQNPSISDVANAYAVSVALTFKNSEKVKKLLQSYQFKRLEWISHIIQIWKDTEIPTISFDFNAEIKKIDYEIDMSSSKSTNTVKKVRLKNDQN
jgi:formate dehydrogenase maturation protein FdhE